MREEKKEDAEGEGRRRGEAFDKSVLMKEGVTIGIPSMSASRSFSVTRSERGRRRSLSKLSITTRYEMAPGVYDSV